MPTALRDPKSIVTPDAFSVAPELLGLQLARSWRRLAALALDGALIVFLQLLGWRVLLGIAALFFLVALGRRPVDPLQSPWRRKIVVVVATAVTAPLVVFAMIAPVLMRSYGDSLEEAQASPPAESVAVAMPEADASPESDTAGPTATLSAEAQPTSTVFNWVRKAADEAGLVFGWGTVYMTLFLTLWKGRTPGKRALDLQVVRLNGQPLGLFASLERTGGYAAGTATGLLGFARVWWDPNRQAIHDKIADTVVVRASLPRTPGLWSESPSRYVSGPDRNRRSEVG